MKKILLIASICLLFTSCATVFTSKKNTVSVKSTNVAEAKVYLNSKELGQGVFKTKVSKYEIQAGDTLVIKCEGYETDSIEIVRKANPWFVALDFASTLGLGLFVDAATGNLYKPNTRNLEVVLRKEGGAK